MWQRFTERARKVILLAQEEAGRVGSQQVATEHLLLGLLREAEGVAAQVLESLGVGLAAVRSEVESHVTPKDATVSGEPQLDPRAKKVVELAADEAKRMKHNYIGTEHLLLGLVREKEGLAAKVLTAQGVTLDQMRQQVAGYLGTEAAGQQPGKTKSKTPALDAFGRDITQLAAAGELDPVIGRQAQIERVIQILCRRTKNNPCLIGEAGVGKTAIVEGLATRIVSREVPEPLLDKRLVAIDLGAVVAGTKYRGEFEERMKRLVQEIRDSKGAIIVFIDELHTMVGAGGAEGALDASNLLKPALARGEMRCIGATTLDEFRKYIEKHGALERRFQSVLVPEPSTEDAVDILKGLRERYEQFHNVKFTDVALATAAELSQRYITDRCLPDKAIDVIDEAGSRAKLQIALPPKDIRELARELDQVNAEKKAAAESSEFEKAAELRDRGAELERRHSALQAAWEAEKGEAMPTVDEQEIAHIVSEWTGVPVAKLTEEETAKLLRMEEELHKRLIGQHAAVVAVSKAIRRARAGLKDPKRPMGSFVFVGPTGVGKTELARALAEFLFDDERALVRVDMSEYMERFAVSRLVGSPPGYVGYDEGGQLTEAVRRRPFSVVLLDEIEKAHPEVFNVLLQIMEDGRLTDAQGRVVDFRNAILIMTSNVGARSIVAEQSVGFRVQRAGEEPDDASFERMKRKVMEEYQKTFLPEFRNRIDEVVVFHSLSKEHIRQIVELLVERVRGELAHRNLKLELSAAAVERLVADGYNMELGARPLRRAIQQTIEDPLSEKVLAGEFGEGGPILVDADLDGEGLAFSLQESPVAGVVAVGAEADPALV